MAADRKEVRLASNGVMMTLISPFQAFHVPVTLVQMLGRPRGKKGSFVYKGCEIEARKHLFAPTLPSGFESLHHGRLEIGFSRNCEYQCQYQQGSPGERSGHKQDI
jgi:hypothetical protein